MVTPTPLVLRKDNNDQHTKPRKRDLARAQTVIVSSTVCNGEDGPMSEPVAIIGMACRFPGAPDLGAFWELLIEGKNTVSKSTPGSGALRVDDVSEERDGPSAHSLFGGFIDEVDLFDPAFFRM